MNDIAHQYNSGAAPVDSTSPITGATDTATSDQLRGVVQRQQSQISLLTRDLQRLQARLRDLESRLDQTVNSIRQG